MGLSILPYFNDIIKYRKNINDQYDNYLTFSKIKKVKIRENTTWNYSYYPIIFENQIKLSNVIAELNSLYIFPRVYFSPSLNLLEFVNYYECKDSEEISKKILCLPTYYGMRDSSIKLICDSINKITLS